MNPLIKFVLIGVLVALVIGVMPWKILGFVVVFSFGAGVGLAAASFFGGYNPQNMLMWAILGGIVMLILATQSGAF